MKTRVCVFGSYCPDRAEADKNRKFLLESSFGEFAEACRELGRRLAKARVVLNACSDGSETADLYVTQGFLEAAKTIRDPASFVQVYRPLSRVRQQRSTSAGQPVFERLLVDKAYNGLIRLLDGRCISWSVAHLRALRDSDSVVTLGGLNNTYAVGTAAVLAGKRLVPIAGFGGASARLLDELGRELSATGRSEVGALSSPCTAQNEYAVLDAAVALAVRREKPRVFMIHGHSRDWAELAAWIEKEVGLKVIDMQTEGRTGETMPQRFESNASSVMAAIAVVTPDDVGWARKEEPWRCRPRGRQNVWLEVGWFWGRLGRDRVMLLFKNHEGHPEIERPSDLQGLEFAEYEEEATSARDKVLRFLKEVEGVT